MATVYVTQENPKLNYAPAEEYGEIVFLTRDDLNPIKNSLHNQAVIKQVEQRLIGFNPQEDYIVISGSPMITALVFMLIREVSNKVNILKWSNRDCVYQKITFSI